MKKHFLLLIMALMSLTGWALPTATAPTGATGLKYNGTAQALLTAAGTATGEYNAEAAVLYYRVTPASAEDMPTFSTTSANWVTDIASVTATTAGSYKVWYVAYDTEEHTNSAGASITVNIATLPLTTSDALAEGLVFTAPNDVTYSGVAQTPTTVNLTYNGAAVTTTGWTVAYKYSATADGEFDTNADEVKTAGFYKQVITVAGASNFSGTATSEAFEVKKADLLAKVKDVTWYYTDEIPAVEIEYDGWVNNETPASIGASGFTAPTAAATKKVVGTEDVTPTGGTATNYEIVRVKGTVTILPAGLKVIVSEALNADFGTDASKITSWTGADYFNATAVTNYISVKKQTGQDPTAAASWTDVATGAGILALFKTTPAVDEPATPEFITGLTLSRADTGTAAAEYEVTATGATAADNYAISEYTPGKFTINAGVATITVENQAKTYGAKDPFADNEWPYTITGVDDASKALIAEKISVTRAEGEDAGSYDIVLTVADNESFTDFTVNAEYKGKLIITKAPLLITASDQVLYTGDKVAALDQTAVTKATLLKNQELKVTLSFGTTNVDTEGSEQSAVAVSAEEGHVGELTTPTTYNYGIVVTIDEGQTAITKNYNITLVNGKLTVLNKATVLYLDDADEALETKLETIGAGTTEALRTRTITFSSRTLKADEWTTLWLPFNTDVATVSRKLGYALVDMLKEDATIDDLNFKIHLGEIPAYTPFLVKVAADVDMATLTGEAGFGAKEILAPSTNTANMTKANKSYEFKSNLNKQVIGQSFWTAGNKMAEGGFEFNKYKATATLKALRAYIIAKEGVSAAPRIFIEEADGTTTAINAIMNENVRNTEGWYTIGGMKLQGAPTQKGIYIQNGKKVVVK